MKRRHGDDGPKPPNLSRLTEESGISLVEVLIAALVIGVAVMGLSLMFGSGGAWVASTGDDRVASGLAQQMIEQVRTTGWPCATSAAGVLAPPCQIGVAQAEPNVYPAGSVDPKVRGFTRVTCIQYVGDDGSNSPAYTEACPDGTVANGGTTNTVRITVTVTPNNQLQQGNPVILQGWLVP
jgi:type II secretory pathway pseudopilin PulG